MEKPYSSFTSVDATNTYGTKDIDAYELFELALNQKTLRVYETKDINGEEKRVISQKKTIAARDRQAKLKQDFKNWVFEEPNRREKLCELYNRLFNRERLRVYDGSHLSFPGMSPEIKLRPHQVNAIARIIYGGNSLLAHKVGAGKTYTMAAAAMELKRLGLAKKPMFCVPNHLVGQWAAEFQRLYPTANILAATKRDFEKQNRKRFCARIATGAWDAVIIGHNSFERVPLSKERQESGLKRDIEEMKSALIDAKGSRSISVKELQRALNNLEFELKKLRDSPKDNLVNFEQLGVDCLFIDEGHLFKNLYVFSKLTNVAGISRARAKKSADMNL